MENEYKADYGFCVKNGAVVGAVFGAISILLYAISESLLANGILGFLLLLAYAVVFAIIGVSYRKHVGGFMTYGQAYSAIFVMIFVSILVSTVFNVILYQLIDPDLGYRLTEISIETSESMMRRFGAPEEQIQSTLAEMRGTNNYTIGKQLLGVLYIGVIGNALVTLILALIAKKNPESEEF